MPDGNGSPTTIKTTSDYAYPSGTTEEIAYEYVAIDIAERKIVGSLGFAHLTAASVVTVRVYEKIDGSNYEVIDSAVYTIGTDPSPHFDYLVFHSTKVTMQIDITEGAPKNIHRNISEIILE